MERSREEREAELFRRIESRLVAVEIKSEGNTVRLGNLEPIVTELRDKAMLAEAIADRVRDHGRTAVGRVTVAVAVAALFVPPAVTVLLVKVVG